VPIVEQIGRQLEQAEIIEPSLRPGETITLFDTKFSPHVYGEDLENRCDESSIFDVHVGARLKVELVSVTGDQDLGREVFPQVYFMVLGGRLESIAGVVESFGFAGPFQPEEKSRGNFRAIRIGFSPGRLKPKPPVFTIVPTLNLSSLSVGTDPSELSKFWLTGSFGSFQGEAPGYNEIVHIGLGIARGETREIRFHEFTDYAPQVVVPIPVLTQPHPAVIYDILSPGLGSGDITTRLSPQRIGAYEVVDPRDIVGYYQRKLIKEGSLLLLVNAMNSTGRYTKREGVYHIGQFEWLEEFDGDVWQGKIREKEWLKKE
jgi:hypothetical protein